ncbi:hypothetical protein B0H19DRAFT_902662, partial [Mycena capillaripes]
NNFPPGYLFLCPAGELQREVETCFLIPDPAAYWSLDPSGADHLSPERARTLGFPDIQFDKLARVRSWDDSVYAGLRKFHEAKGFDPYSQQVALELGYPRFEV